jgi:glutamine amidotransferase
VCRHLAYLGPPVTIAALVLEPPHGLLRQSYAPADMRGGGTVNADGFGVGWYPGPVGEPARFRSDRPLWADTAFGAVAAATRSGAVLAAVRSATVGMPVSAAAAAPFGEGRWLFSHNGLVRGWPAAVADLASALPVTDLLTLDAPTDSALLWALVRHRLRAGGEPAAVLAHVVTEVTAAAPGSRLNLLLTDGTSIWATARDHALSLRVTGDAAVVASEPLDGSPGWVPVPDGHLVTARPGHWARAPLPGLRDAPGTTTATGPTTATPTAGAPATATPATPTSGTPTGTTTSQGAR